MTMVPANQWLVCVCDYLLPAALASIIVFAMAQRCMWGEGGLAAAFDTMLVLMIVG